MMNWQNTVQKSIWAFCEDGVQFYTGITTLVRPTQGLSLGIGGLETGSLGIPSSPDSYSLYSTCTNSYIYC